MNTMVLSNTCVVPLMTSQFFASVKSSWTVWAFERSNPCVPSEMLFQVPHERECFIANLTLVRPIGSVVNPVTLEVA